MGASSANPSLALHKGRRNLCFLRCCFSSASSVTLASASLSFVIPFGLLDLIPARSLDRYSAVRYGEDKILLISFIYVFTSFHFLFPLFLLFFTGKFCAKALEASVVFRACSEHLGHRSHGKQRGAESHKSISLSHSPHSRTRGRFCQILSQSVATNSPDRP